jgi:hypothetical protein
MIPTEEQQAVADVAVTGDNEIVEAGAGSGKTTVLDYTAQRLLSDTGARSGLYLGFNRVTAMEAKEKFPRAVDCRTGHSVAFASHGRGLAHKLPGKRANQKLHEVANILRLSPLYLEPLRDGKPRVVTAERLSWAARETVDRFCRSADPELTTRHIGNHALPEGFDRDQYNAAVLAASQRAWADMVSPEGRLRMPHDVYRKLWALSGPQLRKDFVMLDEAQDTAPVLAKVIRDQHCQQIVVGDSCQQLYAWAGAVNALDNWGAAKRLYLTQSWRFGQAIAKEANKWLSLTGRPLRVVGNPALDSELVELGSAARAVLCRTNVGAVIEVMNALTAGRKVALVGGGDEIERLAKAARRLMDGYHTDHPELCVFDSWEEVKKAAAGDEGDSTLKVLVHMMTSIGPEGVIAAMRQLTERESDAEVTVSTGHKAKGREWESVRIAEDFAPKKTPQEGDTTSTPVKAEDAMLGYVAVTRAKLRLDRGVLAYVDEVLGLQPARLDS